MPGDVGVYFFRQIYSRDFQCLSRDGQVSTSLSLATGSRRGCAWLC